MGRVSTNPRSRIPTSRRGSSPRLWKETAVVSHGVGSSADGCGLRVWLGKDAGEGEAPGRRRRRRGGWLRGVFGFNCFWLAGAEGEGGFCRVGRRGTNRHPSVRQGPCAERA